MLFPDGIDNVETDPSAILRARNVLLHKALNKIRFAFDGCPKKTLWVHHFFLLSTIHPRLNLNVETKLVEILDKKAPQWKEFLDVKETEAGCKVFSWKSI